MGQGTAVKDHATAFAIWLAILASATAGILFVTGLTEKGGLQTWLRAAALILALITAAVGVWKVRNERASKRQQEGEKETLDTALEAEAKRTALLINGAMLGTAEKLQHLASLDQEARKAEVSGFRSSIVSKVCDLMQSDAPRAAYFRVQDLSARPRVMRCEGYKDSRNREDSFTSEFTEGGSADQEVWHLIDHGDCVSSNDLDTKRPQTWNTQRPREYKSFVSVAVRAGDLTMTV
jgi:hypothetical protein